MNKNELHAVRDFSKICVGKNNKYPWRDSEVRREDSKIVEDTNLMNYDHITNAMRGIVSTDNVTLLIEFSETNNVDLKSYKDMYGDNVFHYASRYGAINILKLVINNYQMNVNCKNRRYQTPFHAASIYGHIKIIELLIERNADINTCSSYGNNANHYAAHHGHKHVIDLLIEKGVDVNLRNKAGISPLHIAAKYGNVDVVKSLIMNQADINIKDNKGNTPLDYAVKYGHKNVEELLIEYGADVNSKDE